MERILHRSSHVLWIVYRRSSAVDALHRIPNVYRGDWGSYLVRPESLSRIVVRRRFCCLVLGNEATSLGSDVAHGICRQPFSFRKDNGEAHCNRASPTDRAGGNL